jgi:hypothetical protein
MHFDDVVANLGEDIALEEGEQAYEDEEQARIRPAAVWGFTA